MIAPLVALLLLQEPPPPPVTHSRYGPLTQCLGGYAVTAGASEAILAMEGGITLMTDADAFHLHIDEGDPYRSQQQRTDIEAPTLGNVIRYQRSYGASTPDRLTTYLIPSSAGHPAMTVNSGGFDGSARDLRILGRIARIEGEQGCGNFRGPAFPGETPQAALWRPFSTPGPFYRCQNGVGFPVLSGEALQIAWYDDYDGPSVRLSSPNPVVRLDPIHLVVHGPIDTANGAGPVATAYRPRVETMSDGPNVLLMPPRAASERRGPDQRYRRLIRIAFAPGQDAAARALAGRIEFVARSDPRCLGDPTR